MEWAYVKHEFDHDTRLHSFWVCPAGRGFRRVHFFCGAEGEPQGVPFEPFGKLDCEVACRGCFVAGLVGFTLELGDEITEPGVCPEGARGGAWIELGEREAFLVGRYDG